MSKTTEASSRQDNLAAVLLELEEEFSAAHRIHERLQDAQMYYVKEARFTVAYVLPGIWNIHVLREPGFFGYDELAEATKDSNLWQAETNQG